MINNKCIKINEIITIYEAFYRTLAHNCKHKEVKIDQKMLAVNQLHLEIDGEIVSNIKWRHID